MTINFSKSTMFKKKITGMAESSMLENTRTWLRLVREKGYFDLPFHKPDHVISEQSNSNCESLRGSADVIWSFSKRDVPRRRNSSFTLRRRELLVEIGQR